MSLFLGLKHLWSPSLSQTHLLCLVTMVTSLHTADLISRATPLWEMPNHIYILWLVSFCQGEECSWCHVVLLHSYDILCSFSVCKKSKSNNFFLKNNQIYFSLIFQQLCIFQNINWQLNSTSEVERVQQYCTQVKVPLHSGGQSTQIKYLSKSTDTYSKILLQ